MTKKGFLAGLFLLGISVTAFAQSNETVINKNNVSNNNYIVQVIDQSGGGSNSGTVLIPIKPPKPPVNIN